MKARERILADIRAAQPALIPLPERTLLRRSSNTAGQFQDVLQSIGGKAVLLQESVGEKVRMLFPEARRVVSSIATLDGYIEGHQDWRPHNLRDVDVAIIKAAFGVAENGAVWVTEEDIKIRVLPFICEHLVVVLEASSIIPTMHEAYELIAAKEYTYGVFIAGPSKTADIEQSLVLGAHGPKSMTVLLR